MNKEFRIWDGDEKRLEKAVKRLNRHAQKMGYGEVKVVSIDKPYETRRTVLSKVDGEVYESSHVVTVRNVVVDLPEQFLNPAAAEWQVLGHVTSVEGEAEVTSGEENFIEVAKAAEGFNWRCQAPNCGHALKNAFVVKAKANGEVKLVGSECLNQYTGADGRAILEAIEFISVLQYKEDGDEGGGGGGRQVLKLIDLEDFLAVALAVARRDGGYAKRWIDNGREDYLGNPVQDENAHCTRNETLAQLIGSDYEQNGKVLKSLYNRNGYSLHEVVVATDADKVAAEVQIEAWKSCYLPVRDGKADEYVSQCKLIAERGWVTEKSAGVAASMVKETPKPPKDYSGSKHLGAEGDRMVFENLTVLSAFQREGDFGITTILKFEDADGNVLTWFASGCPSYQKGDKVTLKATVKKHDEYRGVKQTIINRAEEYDAAAEEAKKAAKKAADKAKRAAKKAQEQAAAVVAAPAPAEALVAAPAGNQSF